MPIIAATRLQGASHVPATLQELRADLAQFAAVILGCLVVWFAVRIVANRIERLARLGHRDEFAPAREQRARTLATMLRNSGQTVVLVVGLIMSLDAFGLKTSPLLAGAGVFGLAVSFGAQNLVRDYVTGFFLQFEHQFGLGDTVRIGAVEGTVEDLTLRIVYLRGANGALHIIPNGQITQVTNLSRSWRRAVVTVDVPWQAAEAAAKSLDRVAVEFAEDEHWKPRFLEAPRVTGIERFGAGYVTLGVAARTRPGDLDLLAFELRRRVRVALEHDRVPALPPPFVVSPTP